MGLVDWYRLQPAVMWDKLSVMMHMHSVLRCNHMHTFNMAELQVWLCSRRLASFDACY